MTPFTVFDAATGAVVSNLSVTDISDAMLNATGHQVLVQGEYRAREWRLVNGVITPMPESPGEWAVFDYASGEWTDPRNPLQEMAAARAAAVMPRPDFLLAAIAAGIIQPSDAGPAARGEIPPSLTSVFEGLPPEVQLEAVVRWGAATMIERMNPILLALAGAMGVSEAQLDGLFGI
ncbi:hypothetical protein [Paracoccus simplex]|uniref:Uncharacterized protein n=1 Tax=Paracoccus simplex TaxID=2086346 RepID=A0ABV7RZ85_9RHOB